MHSTHISVPFQDGGLSETTVSGDSGGRRYGTNPSVKAERNSGVETCGGGLRANRARAALPRRFSEALPLRGNCSTYKKHPSFMLFLIC